LSTSTYKLPCRSVRASGTEVPEAAKPDPSPKRPIWFAWALPLSIRRTSLKGTFPIRSH
jgi:hypothetical protein